MQLKGIAATAILLFLLILAFPSQANNEGHNVYYQGPWKNLAFRTGLNYLSIINNLSPRSFADYLWDYHSADVIAKGWASTSDLPDTSDPNNPYVQYKGTPLSLYRTIFNDTARAANLTAQYSWGMGVSCSSPGNQGAKACVGVPPGQDGTEPAGHYWRIIDVAAAMTGLAKGGLTQQEIEMDAFYSGFDISTVMKALVIANSWERTYYPSTQHGDVDSAIYGEHPFVLTFQQPVWAIIYTGAPVDGNSNSTPANSNFGKVVYGWNDAITDCGPNGGSSMCWLGEQPTYFVVPTGVAKQIGNANLTFLESTTQRLIGGAPIVKDIASMLQGTDGSIAHGNICFAPGLNDYGCITLDQYTKYYNIIKTLSTILNAWESINHVHILWGGVPLESTIPFWVSQSHIIDPYSATWTEAFHHPEIMPTPDNVSATLSSMEYVGLQASDKIYAQYLYEWLQNYAFTIDATQSCKDFQETANSYQLAHGCVTDATIQAMRTFIVNQNVATASQVDVATGKGLLLSSNLDGYSLKNIAASIGLRIAYIWNGCNGRCVDSFGQNSDSYSSRINSYLRAATFDQYATDFANNGNFVNLKGIFFYNVIYPYSRLLILLGSENWSDFESALKCQVPCMGTLNTMTGAITPSKPNLPPVEGLFLASPSTMKPDDNSSVTVQNSANNTVTVTVTVNHTVTNTISFENTTAPIENSVTTPSWTGNTFPNNWIPLIISTIIILNMAFIGRKKLKPYLPNLRPIQGNVIITNRPPSRDENRKRLQQIRADSLRIRLHQEDDWEAADLA